MERRVEGGVVKSSRREHVTHYYFNTFTLFARFIKTTLKSTIIPYIVLFQRLSTMRWRTGNTHIMTCFVAILTCLSSKDLP